MRKFALVFLMLLETYVLLAQKKCAAAMSETDFATAKRAIVSLTSMVQKMNRCLSMVQNNCVSVVQIKELMEFFPEDADRFQLVQVALPNVVNRTEIYEAMNSFAYFSTAFKFYDLLKSTTQTEAPAAPARPQLEFAALNYPNPDTYNGKKNCSVYVTDADFIFLAQRINEMRDENAKLATSKDIASKTCFSTAQVMKLASLLKMEKDRMDLLKTFMAVVYDEGNFSQAVALFSHQPNRQEFTDFFNASTKPQPIAPVACEVSEAQHQQLVATLRNQPSSFDRLAIAKNLIPAGKCYTSNQIKDIVALFPSGTDKLEIAKFGFDYVTNTQDFFALVSPLIPSQFDRRALNNYIASKKK